MPSRVFLRGAPPGGAGPRLAARSPGAVLLLLGLASCGGDPAPTASDRETPGDDVAKTSVLEVTALTVAGGLDEDGFTVAVDGGSPRPIAPDGGETFTGLTSGDHAVELAGLATGCSVGGDNPREVTLAAGETGTTAFEVTCGLRDRIVFRSSRDGNSDIWVMEADGGNARSLFATDGLDFDPTVSPDGSLVAFASERAPDADVFEIWVMEADGSNPTNLTAGDEGRHPSFSPDGTRIAFETFRDGNVDIYVTGADGSNPVPVTANDARDLLPAWSPGGSRIVYRSGGAPDNDLHVLCLNGAGHPPLIDDEFSAGGPAWSPDGERIAFSTNRPTGSGANIWIVRSDGTGLTALTGSGRDGQPAWSPQTAAGPGPRPGPSQACQVAAP